MNNWSIINEQFVCGFPISAGFPATAGFVMSIRWLAERHLPYLFLAAGDAFFSKSSLGDED